jgi:2-hydroxychromene-2-carboxylate isomerase
VEGPMARLELWFDFARTCARRGYFGAPTFWVEGELFFGQDRLEEALALARSPGAPGR